MSVLTTKEWVKARLDVVHERLDEMKAENAAFAFFLGERECENRKAHEELSLKVESLSKEFANDNFSITQRLNALEASTRGWTEKGEVQAVNDRLEALEARVALCGGIPEKARQVDYQILHLQEGEGPTLHAFVNWLLSDHYVTKQTPGDAKLITKEQLIGEYLVYRAGFGGE